MLPVIVLAAIALPLSGCSNATSDANQVVRDSDAQRTSASDKLRKSTATIDDVVRGAAAGQSLPASQTKSTSDAAMQDLNSALADLAGRNTALTSAQSLTLGEKYQEYLSLLTQSNDKLTDTVNAALEIPRLLTKEQYSLAGWDQVRTQEVINEIHAIQQRIELLYSDSETLRSQAEKIRKDNPQDFGE